MRDAITRVRENLDKEYFLKIGDSEKKGVEVVSSENPAQPRESIGRIHFAGEEEADETVAVAARSFEQWAGTGIEQRADCLLRAAEIMRNRRLELAAGEILECAKNWQEADGDVCEAIDYVEFYAREMMRLGEKRILGNIPGETNEYFYEPRGVAAVIAPWNFPLAILTGMSCAALVTGNSVILKPAEQSSVTAAKLMEIYIRAGVPPGVVNYLPGKGEVVGEALVRHNKVAIVAFTGSMEVGLHINKIAADVGKGQYFVKKVITEMGGKNAIIVDSTADLDEAAKGVVVSAFGFGGQKCSACSRVILLEEIYDTFLERLIDATRSIVIGKPEEPETFLTPLIDRDAVSKAKRYIEIGRKEGRVLLEMEILPEMREGYYVAPIIFGDISPESRLAQEEIFAPVLAVIKVRDFGEALKVANSTRFALTGGVFSTTPEHIELAKCKFKVGNLYINRKITGAIVARQPFGGFRLSGIGSKAGGPDYLQQFLIPRTVTT